MADVAETPAQKQARVRRERREAKIKAGGADRLDKITQLSGRKPEFMRQESATASPVARSPSNPSTPMSFTPPPQSDLSDPSQVQAQEEFLRSMLRSQQQRQEGGQNNGEQPPEDPMMRMMQQMLGGMPGGDPNDPNAPEMPSFSPDDISKATGIPSFVTNMFLGKPPVTPEQQKQATMWKVVHAFFALIVGLYTVWTISSSISTFGANPPAPATVQNPFLLFVMGELLVEGARMSSRGMGSPKGIGAWYQLAKDIGNDGAVVLFLLGISLWWNS